MNQPNTATKIRSTSEKKITDLVSLYSAGRQYLLHPHVVGLLLEGSAAAGANTAGSSLPPLSLSNIVGSLSPK